MELFDNRLCELKLRPANERLHVEAGKCWRQARAEIKEHGNRARLYPAFIDCQLEALRKYLEDVDSVAREVRCLDGNVVSPEFIRTVLVPRVLTVIAARKGSIGHELDLYRTRTGEDVTRGRHYLASEVKRLEGELADRYEIEALELVKRRSGQFPSASRPTIELSSPRQSASRGRTGVRPQADCWRDFQDKFMQFAEEEERIERANPKDRLLSVCCSYKEHPEVWERGKPGQGLMCLLKTPETGIWDISDGVSENFQARVRALMARAGVALGCLKGTDPEDFWLHHLWHDLRENNSDQLFAASKEGGVIRRVCVASATFCSRLERKAVQESEPGGMPEQPNNTKASGRELRDVQITERREHNLRAWLVEHGIPPTPDVLASFAQNSETSAASKSKGRRPERGDPEIAKRTALVRSNPNTPAVEMCEIFDRNNVPLPAQWLDSGCQAWSQTYKNSIYRSRIHTLISKGRKKT